MGSQLEVFRDHCRRMAKADPDVYLWAHLADEIDTYLAGNPEDHPASPDDQPLEGQ